MSEKAPRHSVLESTDLIGHSSVGDDENNTATTDSTNHNNYDSEELCQSSTPSSSRNVTCHQQPASSSPHTPRNDEDISEVSQQVSSLQVNSHSQQESISSSTFQQPMMDKNHNSVNDPSKNLTHEAPGPTHDDTTHQFTSSINSINSSSTSTTNVNTPQRHIKSSSWVEEEEEEFTQADEEASKIPNEKWALMDNIGFPPPYDSREKELYEQYMNSSQRKKFSSECKESWQEYFMTSNNGFYNRVSYNNSLKSIIRKYGIHPMYRKKIWLELNNVDKKMIENQGYYQKMLQVHQNIYNEAEHQIDLDLSRTFPHHPFFRHANSKGREQLKRILIAFSWRSPYISYTQSMNYIVAMLLLHCDEETAFWLFVELVEEILPKNYYNPQLTGVRIDSRALDELIKNRLPKIHAHFQKIHLDCTAFSSGWFMRLFVDIFPIETTLRILDLVFSEGNKILFRTVLSYLKIYEPRILEMDNMGDVLHFVNSDPCTMYDHFKLTKNMFLFYRLTRQVCLSLRTKYKEIIEKEDEELETRRRMLKK